jgi:hypothetical protein
MATVIMIYTLMTLVQYIYDFSDINLLQLKKMSEIYYIQPIKDALNSTVVSSNASLDCNKLDVDLNSTEGFLKNELIARGVTLITYHKINSCPPSYSVYFNFSLRTSELYTYTEFNTGYVTFSYSNPQTNTSVVGTPCNFTLDWSDNSGLSGYIFSTNNSGTWQNSSWISFGGALSKTAWNVTVLNSSVGAVVQWKYYANNSNSNWAVSDTYSLTTKSAAGDTTVPTYSNNFSNVTNNTAVNTGTPINIGAQWTDNVGLSMYMISNMTNSSGVWYNETTWHTFTAPGNWSNFTIIYPSNARGGNISFKIYANDTSNNQNATGTWFWYNVSGGAPDTTPPTYSLNSTNSTTAGKPVQFNLTMTDIVALQPNGRYIFGIDNCTGSFVNDSAVYFTSKPQTISVVKTINSTVGCTIRWYFNFSDNAGNWNSSLVNNPFSLTTTFDGVLWFKFNEGSGTTAFDSSPNHNDGIIYASGRNQVKNPSFELDKQDWGSGSGDWQIVTDIKYHGSKSSRFQSLVADATWQGTGYVYIPVIPDENITISLYSKGENIVQGGSSNPWDNAYLLGRWINSTGDVISGLSDPYTEYPDLLIGNGTGTWNWERNISEAYRAPPGAVYYSFDIYLGWNATGTLWVDAVQVEYGNTLTDFTDTPWTSGKSNSALEFDGVDDYVNVGNPTSLQLTGDMTISFWTYPTNVAEARENPIDKAYCGEFALTQETDGSLDYYQGPNGGETDGYMSRGWGGIFTNNQWVHVVLVRNVAAQSIKVYKNGVDQGEGGSAWANPSVSSEPVTIGDGYAGSGYHGIIDEVRIYNRALTASEVQTLYGMVFSDYMESGANGWTHGGTGDQWEQGTPIGQIIPSCCYREVSDACREPSSAHSGSNAWGTNMGGCYLPNSNSWLLSPQISLSGLSDATLKFQMAYQFEDNNYDYIYIEVSRDGISFDVLDTISVNAETYQDWSERTYSLSSYVGDNVWIRYRFVADGGWEWTGLYIDDVEVIS